MGTIYALVLLGNTYSALADYRTAADCLRRGLSLNRDLLLIAPVFTGLIGIAALFGRQGQHDLALELLVIILNHPQCSVVARHKAKLMVPELRAHLTADEINAVTEKVKRHQLSNRYIEPNFRVDAKFIDRLLELIDQAVLAEI